MYVSQGKGTFPFEVSVLDIDSDLDWNVDASQLSAWPLSISDDGCLVYFK